MTTTPATRDYWIMTLLDWAAARLMPPQLAECERVLREMQATCESVDRYGALQLEDELRGEGSQVRPT